MFKLVVLSACLALAAGATFDGVDVNALLQNDAVTQNYLQCVIGAKACDESGARLKAITPHGLTEDCARCTPVQKAIVAKIASVLSEKYPTEWNTMLEQVDPKKEHRDAIAKIVEAGKLVGQAPVAVAPAKSA